jgi:hypothetical protein
MKIISTFALELIKHYKLFNQTNMENLTELTTNILVNNGLDFTITKEPLFGLQGKPTPYFGLFNSKSGECINTVKEGYTVSQNYDIVNLALQGMQPFGDDLRVQKAGSLNGGRKVFIQLAIKGFSKVGNDIIERYVTLIDSNDGSTSLSIGIGDLTMSCQNQFWKFYAKGNAKFRHTHTLTQRMSEIPMLIELALNESIKQVELYNKLASTPITKDLAHKLVKELLGYDKLYTSMSELSKKSTKAINIMDNLYRNIDIETADKGLNLWGLHSGVTRFTTHDLKTPKRENGKIESGLIGTAYKQNQNSLKFVSELV